MEDNDNAVARENLNELLIKCIDLRKKIAFDSLQAFDKLTKEEQLIKQEIITKYHQLLIQSQPALIKIKLYIEEPLKRRGPHNFACNPKWTVRTAKLRIIVEFNLDVAHEYIHVVYGRHVAHDWNTLYNCGIIADNDTLYVYIAKNQLQEDVISSISDEDHFLSDLPVLDSAVEAESSSSVNEEPGQLNVSTLTEAVFVSTDPQIESVPSNFVSAHNVPSSHDANPVSNHLVFHSVNDTPVPSSMQDISEVVTMGWSCPMCTFVNKPTRPGCEMCATERPSNYKPPEDYVPTASERERIEEERRADELMQQAQEERNQRNEEQRLQNYQLHIRAMSENITISDKEIECSICLSDINPGESIRLADCLHSFCKECMIAHVLASDEVMVKCPFIGEDYSCSSHIQEREIRSLLPEEKFEQYLSRCLSSAEKKVQNSFHCKTPDCTGWCEYEDGVNMFQCPICNCTNCLTCKVIHENQNCREYQQELMTKSESNKNAKKTRKMLEKLIKHKEAMHCPRCNIIIQKKEGCDWLRCPMCGLEICWVMKMPRWGPMGKGDISGGCHCKENDKKCHPKCVNCH